MTLPSHNLFIKKIDQKEEMAEIASSKRLFFRKEKTFGKETIISKELPRMSG